MLTLDRLLDGVPGAVIAAGRGDIVVREVYDDSRRVEPGGLFVAVPGHQVDGARFIAEALGKGAVAVVAESPQLAADLAGKAAFVQVASARQAVALIAANRFRATPELCLTAVTGTNGKTTTTYLVEALLRTAGRAPGLIGTVAYRFGGRAMKSSLTTPGALALHALLADMSQQGASDVVMEASSIALEQGRLAGCRFRVAALTNVTQDHLDYHGTMARYFAAKQILFRELMLAHGVSVFFVDDEHGSLMRSQVRGPALTLSRGSRGADVVVLEHELSAEGIVARLATPVGVLAIRSRLVGEFNLANLLTAVGIAIAHGCPPAAIAEGIASLDGVPGRMEAVANSAGVLCVVDYAHTPDALERALDALRSLCRSRLICVFGCGGDRDRGKRPLMGQAAASRADVVIVTSDNPRSEPPAAIMAAILPGVRASGKVERSADELGSGRDGFHVEVDRAVAIARAVAVARAGDVVLLAGKGHEDYQVVGSVTKHFDDREVAAAAFAARRDG